MSAPMPERVLTEVEFMEALGISGDPVKMARRTSALLAHDKEQRSRLLAAEARVREVEAAFKKYGDHWGQCPAMTPRRKCNCGYDQARAILAREGA